jgi:hypothetical protein
MDVLPDAPDFVKQLEYRSVDTADESVPNEDSNVTAVELRQADNTGDVLHWAYARAPDERYKGIVKKLMENVPKNIRLNVRNGETSSGYIVGSITYNHADNSIHGLWLNVDNEAVGLATYGTVIHELTHVATAHSIITKPSVKKKVKKLMSVAREKLPHEYAFSSPLEFIAEAFGNSGFQERLSKIVDPNGNKQTLLDRFVQLVRSAVFGGKDKGGDQVSVLDSTMKLTQSIINNNSQAPTKKLIKNSLIRTRSGKPYKNKSGVRKRILQEKDPDAWEVVQVRGGFEGRLDASRSDLSSNSIVHIGEPITADLITPAATPDPAPVATPAATLPVRKKLTASPLLTNGVWADWSQDRGNFPPDSVWDKIRDKGYKVETSGNTANIIDPVGNVIKVKHRGVSADAGVNKDRTVTLTKNGKSLNTGGNKRFYIPPPYPVINPHLDTGAFVQGVRDLSKSMGGEMQHSLTGDTSSITFTADGVTYSFSKTDTGVHYSIGGVDQPVITKPASMIFVDDLSSVVATIRTTRAPIMADLISRRPPKEEEQPTSSTLEESFKNGMIEAELEYKYEINEEGQAVIESPDANVVFDTDDSIDRIVNQTKTDSVSSYNNNMDEAKHDPDPQGVGEWTRGDVISAVSSLPTHMRGMIHIHHDENNPAQIRGVYGFFSPNYRGDGPQMHIDARIQASSLQRVLSTISEEVAHFGLESWSTGVDMLHMDTFFDKAFQLMKSDISKNLSGYITRGNVDMKNPRPRDKYLLVNEMFSKQGTSIPDFADGKSPITGISKADVDALRKAALKGINSFSTSMGEVNNISPKDTESANSFIRQVLQMQTSVLYNKRVSFDYDIGGRTLTIRNTPLGQTRKITTHGYRAEELRSRREIQENLSDNGLEGVYKRFRLFASRNSIFGGSIIGREMSRVISNNSAIASHQDMQVLRDLDTVRLKIAAIAESLGIEQVTAMTFRNGTRKAFAELGVKRKSWLALAKLHDDMRIDLKKQKLQENEKLLAAVGKNIEWVRSHQEQNNITPRRASVMIRELRDFGDTMRVEWEHIRYRAYEDIRWKDTLRDMVGYLRQKDGATDLKAQADAANVELSQVKADRSTSMATKRVLMGKMREKIEPYAKLQNLKEMIRLQRHEGKHDPIHEDVDIMVRYINKIINDSGASGKGGDISMQQISSVRGRKLDHRASVNTSDWHEIEFLSRITDPVEVGIYNIQQLKEIQRTMKANYDMADLLINNDQGSLTLDGDNTDISFGAGQQGTLMKYVSVNPVIAADIREQQDMQRSVWRGVFSDYVSHIKLVQTVGSIFGHVSNITSAVSLMVFYGDAFMVNKLVDTVSGSRQAWVTKMQGRDSSIASDYVKQIISEMQEHSGLGSGLTMLTLEVTSKNDVVLGLTKALTTLVNKVGVVHKADKIHIDDRARASLDFIKEAYAISDDVPKIIRYMFNKELFLAKYEAKMKRVDYDSDALYESAVNDAAAREAVDRTLRENTDYSAMPMELKRLAYNNYRVLFANFLSHSAQVVKIQAENVRIWRENIRDRKEAKRIGAKKWEKELNRSMLLRASGNAVVYGGLYATFSAGSSLFGGLSSAAVGMMADDENIPSDQVLEGARKALQHLDYYSSGMAFNPLPHYEDGYIYAIDGARAGMFDSIVPVPDASNDPSMLSQLSRVIPNLFLAGDQGNIINQTLDAYQGIDYRGQKIKDSAGYWNNVKNVMMNMNLPAAVRELSEVTTGRSWYSGKHKDLLSIVAKIGGVRIKRVKVDKLITSMGNSIGAELKANAATNRRLGQILVGRDILTSQEAKSIAQSDIGHSKKLDNEYEHFIDGVQEMGFKDTLIVKHLTQNSEYKKGGKATFMSKSQAKELVAHRGVFQLAALKRVKRVLEQVRKRKSGTEYTSGDNKRAILSLERLVKQYDLVIRGK